MARLHASYIYYTEYLSRSRITPGRTGSRPLPPAATPSAIRDGLDSPCSQPPRPLTMASSDRFTKMISRRLPLPAWTLVTMLIHSSGTQKSCIPQVTIMVGYGQHRS